MTGGRADAGDNWYVQMRSYMDDNCERRHEAGNEGASGAVQEPGLSEMRGEERQQSRGVSFGFLLVDVPRTEGFIFSNYFKYFYVKVFTFT